MNLLKTKEDWYKIKAGDFISTGIVFSSLNEKGELIGLQHIWEVFSREGKLTKVRGYSRFGEEIKKIDEVPEKGEMFLLNETEKEKFIIQRDDFIKKSVLQELK